MAIDFEARRSQARDRMNTEGLDLLAVGPGDHMTYLLGFHPHPDERPCLLLMGESDAMLVPDLNANEIRQHVELPMETYTDAEGPHEALERLVQRLRLSGAQRVGFDETMRTDFTLLLLDRLEGARPTLASSVLGPLRMRKDDEELAEIGRNAAIADDAMRAAFHAVRPGATESDVAAAAKAAFERNGADAVMFTIVGAGANGAFPHHATGKTELRAGDAVVIDIGARSGHYSSDITRMAVVDDPTDDYQHVHDIVDAAVRAALEAVRPGVLAHEIDDAARQVIRDAGYGEYFIHRTGHGLGLSGHEAPFLTSADSTVLEEGMVFSIEPGIYLPNRFGVRLEEIVVVTATGCRIFSELSREPYVAQAS